MAIDPTSELVRFQHFLGEKLKTGHDLSPEEALDLWRERNPSANEIEDTVTAPSRSFGRHAARGCGPDAVGVRP